MTVFFRRVFVSIILEPAVLAERTGCGNKRNKETSHSGLSKSHSAVNFKSSLSSAANRRRHHQYVRRHVRVCIALNRCSSVHLRGGLVSSKINLSFGLTRGSFADGTSLVIMSVRRDECV